MFVELVEFVFVIFEVEFVFVIFEVELPVELEILLELFVVFTLVTFDEVVAFTTVVLLLVVFYEPDAFVVELEVFDVTFVFVPLMVATVWLAGVEVFAFT